MMVVWRSCLAVAVLVGGAAWAEPVAARDCSFGEINGERILCLETAVPASRAEIWRLLATAEGFSTWAAPVAAVDLRPGGIIETSYDVNARIGDAGNIRNRIIAVEAERRLVMQIAAAPPGFPYADEARELVTSIELEPLSANETHVRVSMSGYRSGEAFDALYAFFAHGNSWTLAKLRERVVGGPTDWRAQAATE
jgi:uncharacterized protein YndB with AHSA1/START domain